MPQHYPLFEARGDAREIGRQHGEQARQQIHGYLDYLARSLQISRVELGLRALRFQPLFQEQCAELLAETQGLAEGAGLPLADALAAQLRGELGQLNDGGCTTFAVAARGTTTGSTLIGQTSDNPPELEQFGYVLKLRPANHPALLMWTFGGMLGYHGINEYGVSHFANALGGGPGWKFALSHYPLKRLILQQRSIVGVRQLMMDFRVCSNGNYMLSDGRGAIEDIELTSEGPRYPGGNPLFQVHTNHYLCQEHACDENWQFSPADSFPRLNRMQKLIGEKFGSISLNEVQGFLSDHEGHPVSICRHSHHGPDGPMLNSQGKTVVALIAEPEYRRLHVAFGNPCENPFVTYELD